MDTPIRTYWDILTDRHRYRAWAAVATALAAHGVRPGPSHERSGDRLYATWSAGFADASSAALPDALHSDPVAIFGCMLTDFDPASLRDFPPGFDWRALTHQTAGIACHHPHLIGLPLEIDPTRLGDLYRLASFPDFRGHSCLGVGQLALSDLVDYYSLLTTLGLSAEHNWSHLQEGLYPLDGDCAPVLSPTPIPTNDQIWPPPDPGASMGEALAWFHTYSYTNWASTSSGPTATRRAACLWDTPPLPPRVSPIRTQVPRMR